MVDQFEQSPFDEPVVEKKPKKKKFAEVKKELEATRPSLPRVTPPPVEAPIKLPVPSVTPKGTAAAVAAEDNLDEFFSEPEKSYFDARQQELLEELGNLPRAKSFVEEIVRTEIEVKRLDLRAAKLQKNSGNEADLTVLTTKLKPILAMRQQYMERMIQAMDSVGLRSQDYVQKDQAATSLSQLHVRYKKALDARRTAGWQVGTLCKEAADLVVKEGLRLTNYSSPEALSDEQRDEVMNIPDGVPPPK